MDFASRRAAAGLIALLALLMLVAPATAADVQYCSSSNTADVEATLSDYQSNGECTKRCSQDYAFAVIQYKSCYCSNVVPADQQSTDDCTATCPGFPAERCGDPDKGLYVYLSMPNHQPSGTQGSPQSTSATPVPTTSEAPPPSSTEAPPPETTTPSPAPPSSSSTTTESSRGPETVVQTVTESPEPATSTTPSQEPTTAPAPTTSTTKEREPTTTAKPQTSLVIVTQSGQVVTQTVINTPTASSVPAEVPTQKGTSTGTIVGGVVGGVAGVAAVAGSIFFLLWRRRQQRRKEDDDEGQSGVRRNTSTMSKAGLIRGEKTTPQPPPPIATSLTNTRRSSRMLDNESISPISVSDRRNSRHLVDQRLNPSAIFVLDNSSRGSMISMEDSRDYHRPLNIRNPDPQ